MRPIDGRLKNIPKEVHEEYFERAVIRSEQLGEEFERQEFEMIFCGNCIGIAVSSTLVTRREFAGGLFRMIRRTCCECGKQHAVHTKPIGVAYGGIRSTKERRVR